MAKQDFIIDIDLNSNALLNVGEISVGPGAIITPPAISGNVTDYNPQGIQTAHLMRLSASSPVVDNISGIIAPDTARWKKLFIINVGANAITFLNNSSASSAANRFLLSGNLIIQPGSGINLYYDQTDQRWRSEK